MILNDKLREDLIIMSHPAHPTPEQMEEVLQGWRSYFGWLDIPPQGQLEEFDGIMRARLLSGVISIIAPKSLEG